MAEENREKAMEEEKEAAEEAGQTESAEEPAGDEPQGDARAGEAGEEAADAPQEAREEQTEAQQEQPEGKQEKKDKKELQIEELQDRVRRQMAEFDNFRKRSEKEKAGMFELGARSVIEQLLPIVDNFERGLAAVGEEHKSDPFVDGMDKVYRQMTEMLQKIGVQPIEAVGNTFNPDFHNAVMHVDDEDSPDNTIVEEFLKGYTYRDQVVRHSMVKVAN